VALDQRRLDKARKPGFGLGLLKGMGVTLKHLFKHNTVIQYPDEKQDLSPRTRGVIALKEENCTVCMLCARECPDWCIYIDSHKEQLPPKRQGGRPRKRNVLDRFAIDYALCMYCGICVEVCPYDALFWSREFEYAEYDIRELTHEKERLSDWMETVLPPPALEIGAEYPGSPTRAPAAPAGGAAAAAEAEDAGGTGERPGAPVAPLGSGGRTPGAGEPKPPMPDVGPVPGGQEAAAGDDASPGEATEPAEPEPARSDAEPAAAAAAAQAGAASVETAPGDQGPTPEAPAGDAGDDGEAAAEPGGATPDQPPGEGETPAPAGAARADVAPTTATPEDSVPSADEVASLRETPGPNVEVPHETPNPAALTPTEDPDEVYAQVLKEQQGKGSSPQVAEARAKVARVKAERGISRGPAPTAPPDGGEGT
jgi:NADH-quinone oxidoreductase chain I